MNTPKVLIVGQPFNNDTGGGITLSNLFAGWEKEKLAVVCSGYSMEHNIDTSICDNYYQLGYLETKYWFPFNYLKRKYYSGKIEFGEKKIQNFTIQKSKLRVNILMKYFWPFINYLGISHVFVKTKISNNFEEWLKSFNPDVIYVQPTGLDAVNFCISISDYLKKPMVFHMMDDWPSIVSGLFKNYWYKRNDQALRKLFDKCKLLLSISDFMAEEYKARYGKDFFTFHNPINIPFWKQHQRTNYEFHDCINILYAGRIGLGIDTSLETIAQAIKEAASVSQLHIKFILQTPEKPEWINKYDCVVHQPQVPYEELPERLAAADFLVLPYDFSEKSIKYIKYSMPTKAPEYMMSGTPIILFAPEDTAVVKYCQKYNCAQLITNQEVSAIIEGILELINCKGKREEMASNAINIVESKHDSLKITKEFAAAISSVVQN
ncbi:MAG: glycosyltransferase [Bacteroidetes bacterium]|nr:glycosyltransferase [Bacteroidota bacterium]